MTGRRTESRHTEHSSSEPLANTNRSFSISRSRSSAGVAVAPTEEYLIYLYVKVMTEERDLSETCIEARAIATIEDTDVMCFFHLGKFGVLQWHEEDLGLHTYYTCLVGITYSPHSLYAHKTGPVIHWLNLFSMLSAAWNVTVIKHRLTCNEWFWIRNVWYMLIWLDQQCHKNNLFIKNTLNYNFKAWSALVQYMESDPKAWLCIHNS